MSQMPQAASRKPQAGGAAGDLVRRALLGLFAAVGAALVFATASHAQTAPRPVNPPATASATAAATSLLATAPAAPRAPRPTTAIDPRSCVTAVCHANVKNYKVVHGPVNVDACDACHKLTDAAKHTYALSRDKTQICTFCHKLDLTGNPVVHKPVTTGDCLPCHNPHGGKTGKFLRGATLKETCDQCHKDVVGKSTHVHGPVAAGACDACHAPHAGKFPKLLVAQGKDLCLTCHKEMSEQLKTMKVVHKPVETGDCAQCHDPHASNYAMQIKAAPADLCTGCHEHDKIKTAINDAKYKHSIVTKDQACLNCHTSHGSQLARLMRAAPVDVCLKCHDQKLKTPDGREVASVADIKDPKLSKHGPVKDGTCGGCHNVHGADIASLLIKAYPSTFYAKYDPDNFALCFTCHDKKLVEAKDAVGLTGFRNGTANLHFVHVDRERGRTCRACHETHASKLPVHLRESVPYGQWELPINFTKTETGGSSAPGCHQKYAYDRNNPVIQEKKP